MNTVKTNPIHIPDEALHLATDCQIKKALRARGHTFVPSHRFMIVKNKDTGATASWTPTPDGSPHRLSYRASILRALVLLGFFALYLALAW